jgi:acetyl-CoA decarbonylase/synthase complex subunit gamma
MAFAMKVAQGAITLDKCTHMTPESLKILGEATEPPMKSLVVGAGENERKLGGETVLYRHEKTFVSKPLYGVNLCAKSVDEKIAGLKKISYERIGERMQVEIVNVKYTGDKAAYLETVKKAKAAGRTLILEVDDEDAAKAALDIVKADKPILNGANEKNFAAFSKIASDAGVMLGVTGPTLDSIHDTIAALEAAGNKNLIIDVGSVSIKEAFSMAVQIRRAALKDEDRSSGYPVIVNVGKLAKDSHELQTALASLFTLKYGSIILMEEMTYSQALPLYGLRQNIYTDPQKPMKFEAKVYPLNGADENAVSAVTVDFALTVFIIQSEFERSGVPINMIVADAGGYSVLTSWAAGKFSAGTIAKFFKEKNIEGTIKNRNLLIPGKVAVLKGELEENLPGWKIIVAPNEAVGVVKFLKELKV